MKPSSNIPVKRTSEGIVKNTLESSFVNVEPASTVFPVKSVLKKLEPQENVEVVIEVDKENVDPLGPFASVEWDDLDAEDAGDPLMVSDYVVEIFEYMNQLEVIYC